MYWYFAGAVLCLIAAAKIRCGIFEKKCVRQAVLVLSGGFVLAALAAWADRQADGESQIARNEPGQGNLEQEFFVDASGIFKDYPIKLEIAERKLTDAQKKEYLRRAKQELDQIVPGKNPSLDQVTEPLYLPEYLLEGAVEASYSFSNYDVFCADGTMEQEPKEPVVVELTAELKCQEETCLYQFSVYAVPKEKTSEEQFAEKLRTLIAEENQQEDSLYVKLPKKVEGKAVDWRIEKEHTSFLMLLMASALAVGWVLREKEHERRQEMQRQAQMQLDYSEIVGKLSLLLGAGMNISSAWEKIAAVYRQKLEQGETERRFAYEEMLTVLYEIQDGIGELQAYENFGRRCQISAYRRLSALIVQNVRKGARGMQKLLEQEEWEAYEQRKAQAKQAGEEAGTKLLLPMGIMLAIVLAILVIPAGMSLNL